MAFKPRPQPEVSTDTPEMLFPLLPRTGSNRPGLWYQQTDMLRDYMTHVGTRDLAIGLPTGTGKTLTGLLIAEWRRRQGKGRAVFACPTVQLVRQVANAARGEGIEVVDLSGSWRDLPAADIVRYQSGRAIAVVTYGTIFNTNPKLGSPDIIVFDDAHAGEQYVSAAYTVSISRDALPSIYEDLVEALKPGLSTERHAQLIMTTPGIGSRRAIDPLFPNLRDDWLEPIDHALIRLGDTSGRAAKEQTFRYAAIRGALRACSVYVSWSKVEIRPTISPTFQNPVFSSATQRIYLSATLGAGGELERAFGRPKVARLTLPESAPKPRSGRRFVVFPHLVPDIDADDLTKQILALADRAVVIAPSDWAATQAEDAIVPDGWTIFRKDDVVDSFDGFAATQQAACVLANRYDGIDLPDAACRVVAIFGLPRATNLHEEFLSSRARSDSAMEERIRSRVVQGTGRCTRNPRDFALVVVADPETTTYLSRAEVIASLDEDLQAEVRFGLEQSETSASELLENIAIFLGADPRWLTDAEPTIGEYRAEARVELPPAAAGLTAAAPHEVRAAEAAWTGDYASAGSSHREAADALASFRDARGYQAYQFFLAATRLNAAGRAQDDAGLRHAADGLADQSVAAATPATWMRASLPLPGAVARPRSNADDIAVAAISAIVAKSTNNAKHNALIDSLRAGLSAVNHADYEPALSGLGRLLGAAASKPPGDGRADSVWCWGDELWLTLEAKSEHVSGNPIGLDDVRQINAHLTFLADDRGATVPSGSASVMISPLEVFKRDALVIAEPFAFKLVPDDILALVSAAERAWLALITLRNIADETNRSNAVADVLSDMRMMPSDIIDRLTMNPIKS
jgi:hypothetical protein